ncbi:hypothetical protein SVIO_100860 [Streptomyces violaceusniger]|uniref:YNCE-like beta-propeller domain-containing protein n=1 Tax=Streptomyces violaceusniger TaxID=68280 RepID=A0A4D4LN19_STRVO|nr:hypothetical protein SVIO_100860 [Streptomyces violaceusniger]
MARPAPLPHTPAACDGPGRGGPAAVRGGGSGLRLLERARAGPGGVGVGAAERAPGVGRGEEEGGEEGRTGPAAAGDAAPLDPHDLYAADRPGKLSRTVKDYPSRVYVPNTLSDTVSVIDPEKFKVIRTFRVGHQPQHVVPSWDLKTLWVNNDLGNTLTPSTPPTAGWAARWTSTTRTTSTSPRTGSTPW